MLRGDGLKIPDLLDAMLPLFALDTYVASPLIMTCAVSVDQLDPAVEASYRRAIDKHWPDTPPIGRVYVHSPEDLILYKLLYFSIRQRPKHSRDIAAILHAKKDQIDFSYIKEWVTRLGLNALWKEMLDNVQ